jgi:hypothetical protein
VNLITEPQKLHLEQLAAEGPFLAVVRHEEGTTCRTFSPRGWDHPLASCGTTSTVPGRQTSSVRVRRSRMLGCEI